MWMWYYCKLCRIPIVSPVGLEVCPVCKRVELEVKGAVGIAALGEWHKAVGGRLVHFWLSWRLGATACDRGDMAINTDRYGKEAKCKKCQGRVEKWTREYEEWEAECG